MKNILIKKREKLLATTAIKNRAKSAIFNDLSVFAKSAKSFGFGN